MVTSQIVLGPLKTISKYYHFEEFLAHWILPATLGPSEATSSIPVGTEDRDNMWADK